MCEGGGICVRVVVYVGGWWCMCEGGGMCEDGGACVRVVAHV